VRGLFALTDAVEPVLVLLRLTALVPRKPALAAHAAMDAVEHVQELLCLTVHALPKHARAAPAVTVAENHARGLNPAQPQMKKSLR